MSLTRLLVYAFLAYWSAIGVLWFGLSWLPRRLGRK